MRKRWVKIILRSSEFIFHAYTEFSVKETLDLGHIDERDGKLLDPVLCVEFSGLWD